MRLSYDYENITVTVIVEIVAVVEIGLESSFRNGSHIIITIVRLSHDFYDYMRTRLYAQWRSQGGAWGSEHPRKKVSPSSCPSPLEICLTEKMSET